MDREHYQSTRQAPLTTTSGQTILEVVIALAIFTFLASALVALVLGGTHGASQGSQQTEATAMAQEGMEVVRSIRDGAYNELISGAHGLTIVNNQWVFSGTQDTVTPFTRVITVSNVCRDGSGNIAACPATYIDPHTRFFESTITWQTIEGTANESAQSAYVTNWDASVWTQTDWVLGPGQAIWSDSARYVSDDGNINTVRVPGQIELTLETDIVTWSDQADPQLPSHHLQDVAVISESNAWAVGDNGTILHYDGSSWSVVVSPYGDRMNALAFLAPNDIWAVGDGGRIIHYNGTQWSAVASPTNDHLNGVSMVSSIEGWAVGDAGKILRWNGVSWAQFDDTGGNAWYDIDMLSSTNGWLVGNQGFIYHWDGVAWTEHSDSGGTVWRSIDMVTALDGWVVGDQGYIYRWNGTAWSLSTDTGGTNWRSVSMGTSQNGWAVGTNGVFLRWNGSIWNDSTSPTADDINGVFMLTDVYGWAVGNQSKLFRYQSDRYEQSGQLTSSAFDMGNESSVAVIEWDETIPQCSPSCDVRFQVRTAPDNAGAPGTFGSWYGVGGVDTFFTEPTGSLIPLGVNGNQWAQYRVLLDGDGQNTPTLEGVRMYYR